MYVGVLLLSPKVDENRESEGTSVNYESVVVDLCTLNFSFRGLGRVRIPES